MKKPRVPKPGAGYSVLRWSGIGLVAISALTLILSCAGFVVVLLRIGPEVLSNAQYIDSQMGGFILIIQLVWFLVPLFFLVLGAGGLGLGVLFIRAATKTAGDGEQITGLEDSSDQKTQDGN